MPLGLWWCVGYRYSYNNALLVVVAFLLICSPASCEVPRPACYRWRAYTLVCGGTLRRSASMVPRPRPWQTLEKPIFRSCVIELNRIRSTRLVKLSYSWKSSRSRSGPKSRSLASTSTCSSVHAITTTMTRFIVRHVDPPIGNSAEFWCNKP
jgi:hypothetical protein